jgi:hypothetical protein
MNACRRKALSSTRNILDVVFSHAYRERRLPRSTLRGVDLICGKLPFGDGVNVSGETKRRKPPVDHPLRSADSTDLTKSGAPLAKCLAEY